MHRVQYVVEARIPGDPGGARRGVMRELDRIAARRSLDLTMLAAQPIRHEGQDLTLWRVHAEPRTDPPRGIPRRAWPWLQRGLLRLGWWDLEREVTAPDRHEALRLARRTLPGAEPLPAGVRVRSVDRRRHGQFRYMGSAVTWRIAEAGALLLIGARTIGTGIEAGNALHIVTGALALLASGGLWAPFFRILDRDQKRTRMAAALVGSCVLLAMSTSKSADDNLPLVIACAALFTMRGLHLFISRTSWRTWVPWLLPALLPLVFVALPGMGSIVYLAYLYPFGAEPSDVTVAPHWQLYAALRWGIVALALLVGPAVFGYLRHSHALAYLRLWVAMVIAVSMTGTAVLAGLWHVVGGPLMAANDAYRAAIEGRTPAKYYGISAEWMCVRPVEGMKPGEVPAQGDAFTPDSPYLKLGDSGGTVFLWRADGPWKGAIFKSIDDDKTLKLPLNKLRVTPADNGSARCADVIS
jgi:hypothetical protein